MALQVGNAACDLGAVSNRDAFEGFYNNFFSTPVYHCSFKNLFLPDSGLYELFVGCFFCYWDSGWYGVPYFRCRPQVCVFSPQHDDTHGTATYNQVEKVWSKKLRSKRVRDNLPKDNLPKIDSGTICRIFFGKLSL